MTSEAGQRSGHGAYGARQQLAEDSDAAAEQRRRARGGYTIMVVEDHAAMLYATAKLLRGAGFHMLESDVGRGAIEQAEVLSGIVLDVNLPDLNGIAVMQEIRRTLGRHTPITEARHDVVDYRRFDRFGKVEVEAGLA